jgi:hypothetical protein
MKMTAFGDRVPCSLAEVGRRFRSAYCLRYQAMKFSVHRPVDVVSMHL